MEQVHLTEETVCEGIGSKRGTILRFRFDNLAPNEGGADIRREVSHHYQRCSVLLVYSSTVSLWSSSKVGAPDPTFAILSATGFF